MNRGTRAGVVALTTALTLAAAGAGLAGDSLRRQFRWRQPVADTPGRGLFRAVVPGPVYDGCSTFPRDLRVLDREGRPIPHYVWRPDNRPAVRAIEARMLNAMVLAGPPAVRQVDIEILRGEPAARPSHGRIDVRCSGATYLRRVDLFASEDRRRWGLLASGYVAADVGARKLECRELRYAPSDLPHLRVQVHPDARWPDERFTVDDVRVYAGSAGANDWEPVTGTLEGPLPGASPDHQTYVFDSGFARRPIERLTVVLDQAEYVRRVRLHGRNAATSVWERIADSQIYRLPEHHSDTIELGDRAVRFLRLDCYHYDDPPLAVARFEALAAPRYLVFETDSAEAQPTLYYGAARGAEARHDLRQRRPPATAMQAPLVALGAREENPAFRAGLSPSLETWLLRGAVAVAALVVLSVILRMMKRTAA